MWLGSVVRGLHVVKSPLEALAPVVGSVSEYVWEGSRATRPETPAVVCPQTSRQLSYHRLRDLTSRLAGWMSTVIGPGRTLAPLLPNSLELVVTSLAALEAGLVLVPVDPSSSRPELRRSLSSIDCIVTNSLKIQEVLESAKKRPKQIVATDDRMLFNGIHHLDDLLEKDWKQVEAISPNAPALRFRTAGGSLVTLNHANIVANCLQVSKPGMDPLRQGSIVAGHLPFFHGYGLTHVLLNALAHGSTVVLIPKFQPKSFLGTIKEHGITVLPTVTSLVQYLGSSRVSKSDLSSLENVTVGGPPVALEDLAKLLEVLPSTAELVQVYGLDGGSLVFRQPKNSMKLSSVGQLLPSTEARILDLDTREDLPDRRPGEICVRGPQMASSDWVETGDLGYYDKDGFFYVTGSLKDILWMNGYRVKPQEIEKVLKQHPNVEDAGVFSLSSKTIVGAVTAKDKSRPPSAKELKNHLEVTVAPHKRVSTLGVVDHIPRTSSGAVDRKKLAEIFKKGKDREFVAMTYI